MLIDFGNITHICPTPTGRFTAVGSVPYSLANTSWETPQEFVKAVESAGVTKVCDNPNCACEKHLRPVESA